MEFYILLKLYKVFILFNHNTFVGLVGKVQKKKTLPKEEGREGGEFVLLSHPN